MRKATCVCLMVRLVHFPYLSRTDAIWENITAPPEATLTVSLKQKASITPPGAGLSSRPHYFQIIAEKANTRPFTHVHPLESPNCTRNVITTL